MQNDSFEFLKKLLETPSPSGFEQDIQRVVKRRVSSYADSVRVDVHGNLIATANPTGKIRVMLAGHCDQIGFMVTHIDEQGYIWFNAIGGIDPSVLPGSRVTLLAADGKIDGIIGYKAVHLIPAHERGKAIELNKLWIDIGAKDGKEAKAKISVGDAIVYHPGILRLGKNIISSPGCDDRVGVYVVMEALRLFKKEARARKSPVALYAVSTVQEEIGLRGAKTSCYGIDPLVGIAVDVTHASDCPGVDAKQVGTVKMAGGPSIARGPNINPEIEKLLVETAKKKKITVQMLAAPGATGTDANMLQVSRSGVAAALVGIPNRYMHTQVETIDLRDLESAAKLIAETCLRITSRMDFIPS